LWGGYSVSLLFARKDLVTGTFRHFALEEGYEVVAVQVVLDALRDWEPGRSITGAPARIDLSATGTDQKPVQKRRGVGILRP